MFIQTESLIPTQPPKNAFNSQLKKQTECLNWLNLCGGFDPFWRRVTKWNQGQSAHRTPLRAFAVGSFSQRTLSGTSSLGAALWILDLRQESQCSNQCHQHLGFFRLFLECFGQPLWVLGFSTGVKINPSKCCIHLVLKFWKTGLETCLRNCIGHCLFPNVCYLVCFSNVRPMILK